MKLILHSLIILLAASIFAACSSNLPEGTLSSYQHTVPVLKNKDYNPMLMLRLLPRQDSVAMDLSRLDFRLRGVESIENVELFVSKSHDTFEQVRSFGATVSILGNDRSTHEQIITFRDTLTISDTTYIWLSANISEDTDLLNFVSAECLGGRIDGRKVSCQQRNAVKDLRLGIALRQQGQDGIHTSRIPGLITTSKGTLIAMYDARREYSRDLQGDIDICINRSTDGGNTWDSLQVVLDMGTWGGLPQKYNGVSDACILSDSNTGDIYVAGLWMYGMLDKQGKFIEGLNEQSDLWQHQWRDRGSQAGFDVKQTSQFLIAKSTDDGLTWSSPVNITKMCKEKDWWLFCPAPGNGITLSDSTLVIPVQGRDAEGIPFSGIIYSRDQGTTWTTSSRAYPISTNECAVVQLKDGSLMLNMRCQSNRGKKEGEGNGRAIAVTKDMGQTWIEHPTSRRDLIEPVCMGSLHRHGNTLIFSNPSSTTQRNNFTLKFSFDNGNTWPKEHWILLDELSGWGYSCITTIDKNTIGILYEGSGAQMVFQKVIGDSQEW